MKTKKLRARIVTIALVFAMVLSIAPTMAFAGQPTELDIEFDTIYDSGKGDYVFNSITCGSSKQTINDNTSWEKELNVTAGLKINVDVSGEDADDYTIEFLDKNGKTLAAASSYTAAKDGKIKVMADSSDKEVYVTMLNEEVIEPVKDGKMAFDFGIDYDTADNCYFDNVTLNGERVESYTYKGYDNTWKEIPAGTTVSINVSGYTNWYPFEVKILDVDNNDAVLKEGTNKAEFTLPYDADIRVSASAADQKVEVYITKIATEPEPEPTIEPVKDGKMAFDFKSDYYTSGEWTFKEITLNGEPLDIAKFEEGDPTWEGIPAGTIISVNASSDTGAQTDIVIKDDTKTLASGKDAAEFTLTYDANVTVCASAGQGFVEVRIAKATTETDDNDDNETTSSANDENTTTVADKDNATTAIADTTAQAKTDAAKTADNNNLAMWIVLICVAGGCVVGATIRKRSANR